METQNDTQPAPAKHLLLTEVVEPHVLYYFLPYLSGLIAFLPLAAQNFGAFLVGGGLTGFALWIQAIVDSALLDKKVSGRPYFRAFVEAQLLGCLGICFMAGTGIDFWTWGSILITALYAFVRLLTLRINPFAVIVHFLAPPLAVTAFCVFVYLVHLVNDTLASLF